MVFKDPSYKVKNTVVDVKAPKEDNDAASDRPRSASDQAEVCKSPLVVAAVSPSGSPSLHPLDEKTMQAVPIDEIDFEMLEESTIPCTGRGRGDSNEGTVPAYIMPTTPSPFLHSAFPPQVVPPFGYGYGMGDGGLPPAFDTESYMPGMCYVPPELYDPNFAYMQYGWGGVPMDALAGFGGEMVDCSGMQGLSGMTGPDGSWDERHAPMLEAPVVINGDWAEQTDAVDLSQEQRPKDAGSRRSKKNRDGRGGVDEKPVPVAAEAVATATKGNSRAVETGGAAKAAGKGEASGSGGNSRYQQDDNGAVAGGDEIPSNFTTVMLRNIPNKYTREMLIKQLNNGFEGHFDFLYLPIDFKNKCNVGYGFINFRSEHMCESFMSQFNGVDVRKCLPGLNSKKVVEVTPARVQGRIENVRRLRNSPVMNQLQDHPEWMPLVFDDNGFEEEFPQPDQPLPPVKPRGRNRDAASRSE